jgi:hypothetical protein
VARRGKILAIKWGMNPNSSSLGVDVTFLIAGAAMIAMATPVVGALLRIRGQRQGQVSNAPAPTSQSASVDNTADASSTSNDA